MKTSEKVRENYLRRKSGRLGLAIKKSRVRTINLNDLGGYMVVNVQNDAVVAGPKFDLDIDEVAEVLNNTENEIRQERRPRRT
jgi:hypothetical protein